MEKASSVDAEVVRQGWQSIEGMTLRQAMFRLCDAIAIVKPPVRSWEWIAAALQSYGVKSERGEGDVKARTLVAYWRQIKRDGLVDEARVKLWQARMREGLLRGEADIVERLLGAAARGGSVIGPESADPGGPPAVEAAEVASTLAAAMSTRPWSSTPEAGDAHAARQPSRPALAPHKALDFASLRAAIERNWALPASERTSVVDVGGEPVMVSARVQKMVASGEINDEQGLLAALGS